MTLSQVPRSDGGDERRGRVDIDVRIVTAPDGLRRWLSPSEFAACSHIPSLVRSATLGRSGLRIGLL